MDWHIFKKSIVFSFDDDRDNVTIKSTDKRFEKCKKMIIGKKLKQLEKLVVSPLETITKTLGKVKGFAIKKNVITYKGEAVDPFYGKKILELKAAKKPYEYLFRFHERVIKNPSKNSQKQLFKFLTHNGFPFTEEGFFIAYKSVNKNFTDKYSGKMDCSLGTKVTMDRKNVVDDPTQTCSAGLHIGTFHYAWSDFSGRTGLTLAVLVDPADVVSVPNDYNGSKCRCCAYQPLKAVTKEFSKDQVIVITDLEKALKVPSKKKPVAKKKTISTDNNFVIINKKSYEMRNCPDAVFRAAGSINLIQPSKRLKYFKDLGKVVTQVWKDPTKGIFYTKSPRNKYTMYTPTDLDKSKKAVVKTKTAKKSMKTGPMSPIKKKAIPKKTAKKIKTTAAKKGIVTIVGKEYKVNEIKETTFKKVKDLRSIKPSARNAYFKSINIIARLWKTKTEFYVLTHDDRYVKYAPVKK